ncbi:DEAD/DEAH box helicase [Bacillus ginsengihumi]|uniref:DEAD/DEAH box helicase n=1 Tax=Heyndrickxia ginsengihumi TaxID=363870 RepID=A0A6M0P380_9BACI|nr:DEAD/DEAH box helicase [Heyndrickxia ginsengihumi]MCM3022129.1 DEAD/DEAH box helicase [Heyndrickxia ginsengihumi]NEY18360.1 DEAD/DEAH box helicase [Heyndrickxia ginsengihumi]
MLNDQEFVINITHMDNGHYFLFVDGKDGIEVDPNVWKPSLFIWHEESYYGTLIPTSKYLDHNGVALDGFLLLSLLGKESFSSLIAWDWNELGQIFLAAAPIMYEAIMDGAWFPHLINSKEEAAHMELPSLVINEFTPGFWEQSVDGISVQSILESWFHHSIQHYVSHHHSLKNKLNSLNHETLTKEDLIAYFDEGRIKKWLNDDADFPFSIGLRLTEPINDHEPWILETVLRDKQNPERFLSYPKQKLYKKWLVFEDDIKKEQQRWIKLFPWLEHNGHLATSLEEELAWEFLIHASEKLLYLGVEILLPSWWTTIKETSLRIKAKIKQTSTNYRPSFVGLNAMLDFDWRLSMNGAELTEEEFKLLIEQNRRLVKINGQWITLDPKMIKSLQELMMRAKKEGLRMQDLFEQELAPVETSQIDEVSPRAFANIQIELNRSLKQFIHQLTNLQDIPNIKASELLQGQLRPYQQLGLNWLSFLRTFRFGAILADDMGLGKTIQLISYLLHVKESESPKTPALIVCPTSVLGNWQKEFERFAPHLKVALHYGANRVKENIQEQYDHIDVVLTSYGLSHIDHEELSTIEWSTLALDEAQNIKNPQTKQSQAIRKLKGTHHIALTGTPMENRLSELWTIFDFANKGFLGTFSQFQKRFILPIEKDEAPEKIRELQSLIRPFLLRRTKKDPEVELNLPDKLEQKEYCPLTVEQASLYEQLIQTTFQQIETLSGFERKGLILQMLNRLKQLCNHPALFLKENEPRRLVERSIKLEKLTDLVQTIINNNEACLIFTQYIGMGEMIQQILKEKFQLNVPFLNGSMPKAKRDQFVEQFQDGRFPIFLLSLKAGGTGLNLTAANHVIHYDRWWNPAVENQATDRAYRIGQKRFVHVHKLITTGTLEEKIDAMLEKKQALNDEIIQSDDWITELSDLDLKNLVSLQQGVF